MTPADPVGVSLLAQTPLASVGDWSPSEFEVHGHAVVSLVRQYFDQIRSVPVGLPVSAQELLVELDAELPDAPEAFESILSDTWARVIPNLVHWNHPRFHAYFSTSGSFPGILADLVTSALNVNAMLWSTAPAASTLESVVLRWIAEMVGLPAGCDGVLINGASLGTLYALAAARDAIPGWNVREHGMSGRDLPRLRIYTSDQAHSSIDKAAIALGVGTRNVVRVTSDDCYRMSPNHLQAAMAADLDRGYQPLAVVATVGTTATGAADPLPATSKICREHDVWLHVDAAYGGFWNLAPSVRRDAERLSLGDSVVVNPHKCLYAPLEVTSLFCRRPSALADTFRLVPEYLRAPSEAEGVDYMNHSLQLGRSFRALKLWWIIRSFGRAGLAQRLEHSIHLARWLEDQVARHRDFCLPASSPFALVTLRYVPPGADPPTPGHGPSPGDQSDSYVDEVNRKLVKLINDSGRAYVSHAVIREGVVIRVSIGNIRTERQDVERLWTTLQEFAPLAARDVWERRTGDDAVRPPELTGR